MRPHVLIYLDAIGGPPHNRVHHREGLGMARAKSVADWMAERGVPLRELIEASALEPRVVTAIVQGRYTPSPPQRQQIAAALGVGIEEIAWGHRAEIAHVYGHGPQFGRSP